jgi:hypothetical protein
MILRWGTEPGVQIATGAALERALNTILAGPAAREPLVAHLVGETGALGLGLDPSGGGLLLFAHTTASSRRCTASPRAARPRRRGTCLLGRRAPLPILRPLSRARGDGAPSGEPVPDHRPPARQCRVGIRAARRPAAHIRWSLSCSPPRTPRSCTPASTAAQRRLSSPRTVNHGASSTRPGARGLRPSRVTQRRRGAGASSCADAVSGLMWPARPPNGGADGAQQQPR